MADCKNFCMACSDVGKSLSGKIGLQTDLVAFEFNSPVIIVKVMSSWLVYLTALSLAGLVL